MTTTPSAGRVSRSTLWLVLGWVLATFALIRLANAAWLPGLLDSVEARHGPQAREDADLVSGVASILLVQAVWWVIAYRARHRTALRILPVAFAGVFLAAAGAPLLRLLRILF